MTKLGQKGCEGLLKILLIAGLRVEGQPPLMQVIIFESFVVEVYVFILKSTSSWLKSTSSYWSLHEWPCVLKVFATKPSTGTWRHLVEFPKGQVWSSFWSRSRPFQVPVSLINHMTGPRFCFLGIDIFNELYHQIFQNVPVGLGSNQAIIFEQWFEYLFEFIRKSTWIWKRWFSDWRIEFTQEIHTPEFNTEVDSRFSDQET